MILALGANGVSLMQADDFHRFHCEINLPGATLEVARAGFADIAQLETSDTAWVDVEALLRLGRETGPPGWTASATAMIEKARIHGWTRDDLWAVKDHVVGPI